LQRVRHALNALFDAREYEFYQKSGPKLQFALFDHVFKESIFFDQSCGLEGHGHGHH
jgi:hypothetical protein